VAFGEYWFGARSLDTVKVLLINFRARFAEFPAALAVLQRWPQMDPATRRVLCHWHLQLSDPLYRDFTGAFLVDRHAQLRPQVRRDGVITWVGEQGPGRLDHEHADPVRQQTALVGVRGRPRHQQP
jgi:hypothetical protein